MLSPRWYLEGQAVWAETEFTPAGRGQSTYVDMLFRCAVHDDNLLPYNEWYMETPRWPYWTGAYIYGMRLMQYLSETSERGNPVGDAVQGSAQAFLFSFNRGAVAATGKSFASLAAEMLAKERTVQNEKLQILGQKPFTPVERLTSKHMALGQVLFAGDTIFFSASEENNRSTLFSYDPLTRQTVKINWAVTTSPFGSLSASRDGRLIYYTRLEIEKMENEWYEVRCWDTQTGRGTLVTKTGRYRTIALAPDGETLAAVSQRQGKSYLIEVPLAAAGDVKQEKILADAPLETDLAAPQYAPDGTAISYVEGDGSRFRLKIYDRRTALTQTLFSSPYQIIAPVWHPDGSVLVFGSDMNGVYNLYLINRMENAPPRPLTHVWGGLFFPCFNRDGNSLAAVAYDGFGPHLTIIPYAPDRLTGMDLPIVRPNWSGRKSADLKARALQTHDDLMTRAGQAPQTDYNSFSQTGFDYWSPWLTASTFGVQGGLAARFSDPAGFQDLTVLAGAESKYGSPLAGLRYDYRGFGPELTFYTGADQEAYPDLLVGPDGQKRYDYAEETRFSGLSLSLPLLKMERELIASIGFEHKQRDTIEEARDKYKNESISLDPTEKDESLAWTRLTYFSGTGFNRSISIEDGFLASVGAERAFSGLGGEIDATRLLTDAGWYISMPFQTNHVLKISAAYGHGWGDAFAQGLFGLGGFGSPVEYFYPGMAHSLTLRGYDPNFQTGHSAFKAGASYRFPLRELFKGKESHFPVYYRSLAAEVFYEGGRTWDDQGRGDDIGWLNAYGIEANYGLTLFRYLQMAPGIGAVYAPQRSEHDPDQGKVTVYLSVKAWYHF